MITLTAIFLFVLFLKLTGMIFKAGMRALGWLFGGLGFVFSILLAVSVLGFVFDMIPILLVIGVIMIARRTA